MPRGWVPCWVILLITCLELTVKSRVSDAKTTKTRPKDFSLRRVHNKSYVPAVPLKLHPKGVPLLGLQQALCLDAAVTEASYLARRAVRTFSSEGIGPWTPPPPGFHHPQLSVRALRPSVFVIAFSDSVRGNFTTKSEGCQEKFSRGGALGAPVPCGTALGASPKRYPAGRQKYHWKSPLPYTIIDPAKL